MKLIIGLGNIGKRYAHTRHNIGFMVADELLRQYQQAPDHAANAKIYGHKVSNWKPESKFQAEVAKIDLETDTLILAKPSTMMNLSGEAVQRLMQFYKIAPADVWILFDDLDVPFGRLRIRASGSSGGHQGINSTIRHIGAGFVRVRIGISLNDRNTEPSEVYVLKPFNPDEQAALPRITTQSADIIRRQLTGNTPTEATFDLTEPKPSLTQDPNQ